jgi:hypothetical protein
MPQSSFPIICTCGEYSDKKLFLLPAKEKMTCPKCGKIDIRQQFGATSEERLSYAAVTEMVDRMLQAEKNGDEVAWEFYVGEWRRLNEAHSLRFFSHT